MDFANSRYFKLNRYLLSSVCLWPYQTSRYTRIARVICESLLLQYVLVQLAVFITTEFSLELFLRVMMYTTFAVLYLLKYNVFVLNAENVKELLEQIQCEWFAVHCHEERVLLEKYANFARYLALFIAYFFYFATFGFLLSGLIPGILDIAIPLNVSRTPYLPVLVEYFIDQDKYFYLIYVHIYVTIMVGVTTLVSTESISALFVSHACVLFRISSYRIETLTDVTESPHFFHKSDRKIYGRIINAIRMYQKAVEYTELFANTFMGMYFIMLVCGVAACIAHLFRVCRALSLAGKHEEIISSIVVIGAELIYMFSCNYVGQKVIDHNVEVSAKLCESLWYRVPLPAQKLLLAFMQRATKKCMFVPGGVFVASFQGFSSLINLSFSYFMVIYSREQQELNDY